MGCHLKCFHSLFSSFICSLTFIQKYVIAVSKIVSITFIYLPFYNHVGAISKEIVENIFGGGLIEMQLHPARPKR